MSTAHKPIQVSSVGLVEQQIYVAHTRGNWGPENDHCKLVEIRTRVGQYYQLKSGFLAPNEQFKIVVPKISIDDAYTIYTARQNDGVHTGDRFDYDQDTNAFWILASSHPVVNLGQWNQNNINLTH